MTTRRARCAIEAGAKDTEDTWKVSAEDIRISEIRPKPVLWPIILDANNPPVQTIKLLWCPYSGQSPITVTCDGQMSDVTWTCQRRLEQAKRNQNTGRRQQWSVYGREGSIPRRDIDWTVVYPACEWDKTGLEQTSKLQCLNG